MLSLFTKKKDLNKENYRPVSLLSYTSKVFERLLHKQIKTFISNKLSNKLSGFRKNYNTQYCLTYMLEKWKNTLDKGKHVGAVFMDLSKAFYTINHDLLIAKLEAYGFSNNALLFMLSYLKNRSERVSIKSSFSTWEEIIAVVPQGSILGPLLFNIFLNDIFYFENRSFLSNYADDNVLYAFGSNLDEVKQNLSQELLKLSEWFYENCTILNPEKCHYMCLGKDSASDLLRFRGENLVASELETVLGIQIDNKLNFENHIKSLSNKASLKLGALQRILKYVRYAKGKSSVQFYYKNSIQLLPTCLDVLLKKIKFSSEQCS